MDSENCSNVVSSSRTFYNVEQHTSEKLNRTSFSRVSLFQRFVRDVELEKCIYYSFNDFYIDKGYIFIISPRVFNSQLDD